MKNKQNKTKQTKIKEKKTKQTKKKPPKTCNNLQSGQNFSFFFFFSPWKIYWENFLTKYDFTQEVWRQHLVQACARLFAWLCYICRSAALCSDHSPVVHALVRFALQTCYWQRSEQCREQCRSQKRPGPGGQCFLHGQWDALKPSAARNQKENWRLCSYIRRRVLPIYRGLYIIELSKGSLHVQIS